jgi:hypothetical protein
MLDRERRMRTERRLVTDVEAKEMRGDVQRWGEGTGRNVLDLLDTRDELLVALEQIAFASTDALSRRRASKALAQVRGESDD